MPLPPDCLPLVLGQMPGFLAAFCRDGKLAWSNQFAYGWDAPQLLDQPSDTCIVEEDRPLWWAAFFRCRDRGETPSYAVRIKTLEPPYATALAGKLYPIRRLDTGALVYIGCLCEDVTHAQPPAAPATPALPPRPPHVPASAKWLSPLGESIVAFVAMQPRPVTAEVIAAGIAEPCEAKLRTTLAGLVARGILRRAGGYELVRD